MELIIEEDENEYEELTQTQIRRQQLVTEKQQIQRKIDLTYEDILAKMGIREHHGQLVKTPPATTIATTIVASKVEQKKNTQEQINELKNAALIAMIQREKARRIKPKTMLFAR